MKTGGACGGFLKAAGAMVDVVRGFVKDVVYAPSFTVRGLNSLNKAENLAEKRRGNARMKAIPTNNAAANKAALSTLKAASLSLISGVEHFCVATQAMVSSQFTYSESPLRGSEHSSWWLEHGPATLLSLPRLCESESE